LGTKCGSKWPVQPCRGVPASNDSFPPKYPLRLYPLSFCKEQRMVTDKILVIGQYDELYRAEATKAHTAQREYLLYNTPLMGLVRYFKTAFCLLFLYSIQNYKIKLVFSQAKVIWQVSIPCHRVIVN